LSTAHMSPVTGPVLERSSDTVPSHSSPTGRAPDASTLLFSDTETVTLGAGGTATATSAGYTSQNTGTDYWVATFNGDSNNGTAKIGRASCRERGKTTEAGRNMKKKTTRGTGGRSIGDKATVTGLANGRRSDTLTSNWNSAARVQNVSTLLFSDTETVTLGAGGTATATSAGYTSQNTGTDYWVATFNGDSNNGTA